MAMEPFAVAYCRFVVPVVMVLVVEFTAGQLCTRQTRREMAMQGSLP